MSGSNGEKSVLADSHGRRIDYARISITDRCTFRCIYCMPREGEPPVPHEEILRYEEILRLTAIMTGLGVTRFKVTGGEPLCRKGCAPFIASLKARPGVTSVTLTTNGAFLERVLPELVTAGLDSLTVSLDAFSQETHERMTGGTASLKGIFASMEEAAKSGIRVKINMVPIKGLNDHEILPLARYALERGYQIRFIELMPIGKGVSYDPQPGSETRRMIESLGSLTQLAEKTGNGPARCASVEGYPGTVGFISAVSDAFCAECNRIRLTPVGFLKTCLHHGHGVSLKEALRGGASDDEIAAAITQAVKAKPLAHAFAEQKASGRETSFSMHSIGG